MFYVEDQGLITDYQVKMNKEQLESVRTQIIYQCSVVEKRHMNDSLDALETETRHNIRNITKKEVDRDYETRYYYSYDYDHYQVPKVVETLNALLRKEYDQIEELRNVEDVVLYPTNIEEQIAAIMAQYDDQNRIGFIRKMDDEVTKLREQIEREESRIPIKKSVRDFVPNIEDCFTFTPGISISTEAFHQTMQFIQETDRGMTLLKVDPPVMKSAYVVQLVKRRMNNEHNTRTGK